MNEVGEMLIKSPILPEQLSSLSEGDELWHNDKTRIFYPENPLVSAQEGIHLRIESKDVPLHPKTPAEWKGFLETWAIAIGSGKVISEGRALDDMWQSFIDRTEYSPDDHLVIDVIGRNPTGKSWAKTAPLPDADYDNRNARLPSKKVQEFGETLQRYFRRFWLPHVQKVDLFSQEMNVDLPGSEGFNKKFQNNTALPFPWQSEPLFVSNYIDAVAILHPHLKSGLHIYIGVANAPHRPWNDLPRALQAVGLAEATAQVFEEIQVNGQAIAAETSVRITGSWYRGFKDLASDPDFVENFGRVPTKWFKRRFREKVAVDPPGVTVITTDKAGPPKAWTMSFHPHVYGVRTPNELMRLTQRPRNEGGSDWEGIEAMSPEKRIALRDALNARLPKVVSDMKGLLTVGTV